ncbi:MAG TPA: cell division/cell wall cluster transcriptional repressor MraZ [Firmicutes bacterium]|nr:cell division/cell wall cluster transcriptional repressor MraZ [Bacillota bacterium]
MLFGSYEYQLDDKGRVVIPAKLRNSLGNTVYLLKGYDGCISIYPEESFNKFIEKLENLPFEKEKARLHQRVLLSSRQELVIDKQGRLLIPKTVINKYSLVNKEIMIIGMLDHLEIWDKGTYQNYIDENELEFEKNAEDLLSDE